MANKALAKRQKLMIQAEHAPAVSVKPDAQSAKAARRQLGGRATSTQHNPLLQKLLRQTGQDPK